MNTIRPKTTLPKTAVPYPTDQQKWDALRRRDPQADGHFFYSVKTTGVYCRPSCPSRLPLSENVAFYASTKEAERAGFRACKRCQPDGPGLSAQYATLVAKACRIIETAERAPKLDELARTVGMSRFHFHRIFKKTTGLSPKAYATGRRTESMRKELPRSPSVTEAIYKAGYQSNGRFYAESSQTLGMRPQDFRQGGHGTTIRFAVGGCTLGSILVAASGKGVCAIFLGNDPGYLVDNLQRLFPKAKLVKGDKDFEHVVAAVINLVEKPQLGTQLPLDIQGTAFQQRVWQALRDIPLGQTISYTELAQRIGQPKAVRAVAGACGANPIAVVIPCHRVVRSDGDISGYHWGVERKRKLLAREKAVA